ncbi:MAG: hypothetical protein EXR75_08400 [Myxococcales bacterium]|nr:hypothetical protein [Myxococcales bacterium]
MIDEARLRQACDDPRAWLVDPGHARAAYLVRRRVLADIGAALDQRGLAALVVKGAALAETAYPHPWSRPMSDIDLVVRPAELDATLAALAKLGGLVSPVPRDRRWSFAQLGERAVTFQLGAIRCLVEVHTHIDRIAPRPVDWEGVRLRSAPMSGLPESLLAPSFEDHALIVILHAALSDFQHPLAWVDLAQLWRQGVDVTKLVRRAREWRLGPACHRALSELNAILMAPQLNACVERFNAGAIRRWLIAVAFPARPQGAPRVLGLSWIARQAVLRDDPLRWLCGTTRFGVARLADRVTVLASASRIAAFASDG